MKRGNIITALLTVLAALLLVSCDGAAEKKEIAVLCPFSRHTQIWDSFIKSAKEEYADTSRYNLHFFYVSDYIGKYWEKKEYEHDVRNMLRRALNSVKIEVGTPDLIIIYGDDVAGAVAQVDDPLLKDTPILCAGQVHPTWKNRLPPSVRAIISADIPPPTNPKRQKKRSLRTPNGKKNVLPRNSSPSSRRTVRRR